MARRSEPPAPTRARVGNAAWDARAMLRKAIAGAYPSAAARAATREAEIAYWRARVEAMEGGEHDDG